MYKDSSYGYHESQFQFSIKRMKSVKMGAILGTSSRVFRLQVLALMLYFWDNLIDVLCRFWGEGLTVNIGVAQKEGLCSHPNPISFRVIAWDLSS